MRDLTNLELCKIICEIRGFNFKAMGVQPLRNTVVNTSLMFKYGVSIDYIEKVVFIKYTDGSTTLDVKFNSEYDLPRAILECIAEAFNQ